MPISEPLKVSISPKAIRSEWCISPNGGQTSPAVSNAHPKVHIAVAMMSCKRFMLIEVRGGGSALRAVVGSTGYAL